MCRICGILFKGDQGSSHESSELLKSMRDTMAYGGPDDAGEYIHENIALGHRRLSIIDLSTAGHQPMHFGDYTIVYNGEIYNYQLIREELVGLGHKFETGSDTEVIIKSYMQWGLDGVSRFQGMFAFALWNKERKKLILCRDRVGVKPLYWYQKDNVFMFASELKAFHKYPQFDKTIDHNSVGQYLQQGYIQAPHTIFKYAKKLLPGSCMTINDSFDFENNVYWDPIDKFKKSELSVKKEDDLTEELEGLLLDSFKLRMVSDVPVGMFLSGGIDSSLVSAMLQKEYNKSIKTFTIGFEEQERNEAPFAKQVAQHIGSDHYELICTENDFKSIVKDLAVIHDEPFGDSSSIPTLLVSRLAREHVKVSLSADGGDELFGGYTKYEITKNVFTKLNAIPRPINRLMKHSLDLFNLEWLDRNSKHLPFLSSYSDVANKLTKFKHAMDSNTVTEFFNISSCYLDKELMSLLSIKSHNRFSEQDISYSNDNLISYLGMIDIKTYLEGDILTKVDRATMQVSLEGREPMLDHKLIEFSYTIPDHLKIKGKESKYLLRKILRKYIPSQLIDRPKQGFSIPLAQWLKGFLKEELIELQNDTSFYKVFRLNHTEIRSLIDSFLNDKQYVNPHFIWFLFGLHKWQKQWLN